MLLLTFLPLLAADDNRLWKAWEKELRRQCPSNHVEWTGDGSYDDLLGEFIATLPAGTQKRVSAIADYAHRCSTEMAGFSCEMAVHIDAFSRLGLLSRFAAFGCQHYKCTEPALCTRKGR